MVSQRTLLCGSLLLLTMVDWCPKVGSLQCYGCNLKTGSQEMDVGCSSPEQMTCSPSHQGFKHRFCIRIWCWGRSWQVAVPQHVSANRRSCQVSASSAVPLTCVTTLRRLGSLSRSPSASSSASAQLALWRDPRGSRRHGI
ncbi:uncharacterized protein LOC134359650 isoform X1 [Mobula hypostoma]|uniref:uncharacterized protein LOC134359650 isoform X1 n=1 Tax=Mobula hypostoma TaxID=723540 RepID=UPI002FC31395